MAATRALPAGLGELEVLAVGTVLLMEDSRSADSQQPAGTEPGPGRHWDQPECPCCSGIQPPPADSWHGTRPSLWCCLCGCHLPSGHPCP
uniref:Retinal G protein coupled receptor n=1 Tax=Mus musculus TaxID=10090 RepID=A0A286YDT4_MOUSE